MNMLPFFSFIMMAPGYDVHGAFLRGDHCLFLAGGLYEDALELAFPLVHRFYIDDDILEGIVELALLEERK